MLVLAGDDDPMRLFPVAEELASRLPAETTRLVRLPGARHTIFRDRPDLTFPAVRNFVSREAAGLDVGSVRGVLESAALPGPDGADACIVEECAPVPGGLVGEQDCNSRRPCCLGDGGPRSMAVAIRKT
jgi:hypothetical protein